VFLLSLGDSGDKSLSQPENINTAILVPVKYPILLFFIISPLSQNALPHSETVKKILQVDSEAKALVPTSEAKPGWDESHCPSIKDVKHLLSFFWKKHY